MKNLFIEFLFSLLRIGYAEADELLSSFSTYQVISPAERKSFQWPELTKRGAVASGFLIMAVETPVPLVIGMTGMVVLPIAFVVSLFF